MKYESPVGPAVYQRVVQEIGEGEQDSPPVSKKQKASAAATVQS